MLFPLTLSASVFILKNGEVITGKVIAESQTAFTAKNQYGIIHILKKEIQVFVPDENHIATKEVMYKGKKQKLKFLAKTESEKIYMDENSNIVKIPLPKQNKNQYDQPTKSRFTSLSFSIQTLHFPTIRLKNQTQPEITLSSTWILPIYQIGLQHFDKVNSLFGYGIGFHYAKFSKTKSSTINTNHLKVNYTVTQFSIRLLFRFYLFHRLLPSLPKTLSLNMIPSLQYSQGKATLLESSFSPETFLGDSISIKSVSPTLTIGISYEKQIPYSLFYRISLLSEMTFEKHFYTLTASKKKEWEEDPDKAIFLPVVNSKSAYPVGFFLQIEIGIVW
ncbi:MAG: hypothetical protein D6767_05260 [Candidatus Hydrogenedentota bacterium]|nr:MAG: hypothetical protein D6767_05260 [Candidatus Hydrogenedentota bacterium]